MLYKTFVKLLKPLFLRTNKKTQSINEGNIYSN